MRALPSFHRRLLNVIYVKGGWINQFEKSIYFSGSQCQFTDVLRWSLAIPQQGPWTQGCTPGSWQARARQYDNLLQQSTYRERSSSFTTEEICQMLKAARINLLIRQVSKDARYLRVFLHQDCSHSHVLNGVRLLLSTIVCLIKLQE